MLSKPTCFLLLITALLAIVACSAAEQKETAERETAPTHISARYLEKREEGNLTTLILIGDVVVKQPQFLLTADAAVVWILEDTEKRTTMYAEGEVRLVRDKTILTGKSMCLDLTRNRAEILDAAMRLQTDTGSMLIVRGKRFIQRDKDTLEAEGVTASNATFGDSNMRITAKHLLVREGRHATSQHTALKVGPVPLFYTPLLYKDLKHTLIRSVDAGHSDLFGYYTTVDLGFRLNDHATLLFDTDYYEYRGTGWGADLDYRMPSGKGYLDTYFLSDHRNLPDSFLDDARQAQGLGPNEMPVPLDETQSARKRVHWVHHQRLPHGWFFDGEIFYLSDRRFQQEFFEDEYHNGKTPESNLLLIRNWDHYQFSVLAKPKLNHFQTQTEYLPKIGLDINTMPFFNGRMLYDATSQVAWVSRDFDNDDKTLEDYNTMRMDAFNKVSLPFSAGFLGLEPFGALRTTWYGNRDASAGNTDDDIFRMVGEYGINAGTEFFRVYDVDFPALNMRGMRHLIQPVVTFQSILRPSVPKDDLLQFDTIDEIEQIDVVRLNIRNVLETKLHHRDSEQRWPFVVLDFRADFYPSPDRDNNGHVISDFSNRLRIRPTLWLNLFADTIYNTTKDVFDVASVGIGFNSQSERARQIDADGRGFYVADPEDPLDTMGDLAEPNWFINVANHNIHNEQSLFSVLGGVVLSEKWAVTSSAWFEWGHKDLLLFETELERTSQDWIMAWRVSMDQTGFSGETETSVHFSFTPRLFSSDTSKRYKRLQGRSLDYTRSVDDF